MEDEMLDKEKMPEQALSSEEITGETAETASAEEEVKNGSIQKIKQFANENENKAPSSVSLRNILGGDFLNAAFMRRQLPLIILIAVCCFIYISNRYSNQMELIEIDRLKNQLDDARFNALTRSSELTAKSRQSYVEEFLRNSKDSTLQISTHPPFVIYANGEKEQPESSKPSETISPQP